MSAISRDASTYLAVLERVHILSHFYRNLIDFPIEMFLAKIDDTSL